ncbi:methyltransferase-like protein 27 [Clavelina lepadiformis]|uniref:methyltransferase-like protein 27 n=1 Tax=Clavelina lepadiformis TaxID=159417 RepID=UPI0040433C58
MTSGVNIPHNKELFFLEFVSALTDDVESNKNVYNKIADEYDDLARNVHFHSANHLARLCMDNLTESMKKNVDNCRVLDVAAGTGLFAEGLRAAGFTGRLDGIEGANGMCEIAREKGIYSDLRNGLITLQNPLSFDDDSYDVVVVSTALTPGHVPDECLFDCIRVLKSGGLLIFNTFLLATTDPSGTKLKSTLRVVKKIEDDGLCKRVVELDDKMFDLDHQYHKVSKNVLYCYQKN